VEWNQEQVPEFIRRFFQLATFPLEDVMSLVMIKCPHTARPVSTGIEVEEDAFFQFSNVTMECECSACGMRHVWRKGEAWLGDYVGQPVTDPPGILRPLDKSAKL
jgi:hypothetical protein